jgi:hypothetical protein
VAAAVKRIAEILNNEDFSEVWEKFPKLFREQEGRPDLLVSHTTRTAAALSNTKLIAAIAATSLGRPLRWRATCSRELGTRGRRQRRGGVLDRNQLPVGQRQGVAAAHAQQSSS